MTLVLASTRLAHALPAPVAAGPLRDLVVRSMGACTVALVPRRLAASERQGVSA
jgi:hypothetical protein